MATTSQRASPLTASSSAGGLWRACCRRPPAGNLASSRREQALQDGLTTYTPAAGIAPLREAMAKHVSAERGLVGDRAYAADNVCVQPGGKPVIFKFLLSTMNAGDGVLYPSPGYPIYESLIRFLGGVPLPYTYKLADDGTLALDMDVLKRQMDHPRARVLLWNDLHNPTGYCATKDELESVAQRACDHNMWVLSDEAYFHVVFDDAVRGQTIASYPGMRERTVMLVTASKTWAMTGWRVGAAVGPAGIIDSIVKLATNDEGCTNHFVQAAALAAFSDQPSAVDDSHDIARQLK